MSAHTDERTARYVTGMSVSDRTVWPKDSRVWVLARLRCSVCVYLYVCIRVRFCESVRVHAQKIAKELPCVLTVRDVGKVSALLSFQLRSSTTPARDLPSPLSLCYPSLSLPLPPASTSSYSFSYSAGEGRLPLANVSSARFLQSALLTVLPTPHDSSWDPGEVDGVGAPLPPDGHRHTGILPASRRALAEARGKEREKERQGGIE